ncbi:MAG: right-handed parallel beta-helix repeat-containing protein [Acidimicrobiia bacterium]|nr:right-handed parallel beta-helix repeat-containing protein [Acidimicrobiia bacterium]
MGWRKRILRRPLLVAFALVAAAVVGVPPAAAVDGGPQVAFYDSSLGLWRMEGIGDFYYGIPSDQPMLCDWNGDGTETVGLYRPTTGFLHLRQQNNYGFADVSIYFGIPEDRPVCGDWNGDGIDTVGVYRSSNRTFYLRNSNVTGIAEQQFTFGDGNGTPIAGDWNGDGKDTVGLWKQGNAYYELSNGNTSAIGPHAFLGNPGDPVVVADFDQNGRDTLGVYRTTNGRLYLSGLGEDGGTPREYSVGLHVGIPVGGVTGGTPASPVGGAGGGGGGTVPPGAISVFPGSSIQDAINAASDGSTLYIRSGTHRMQRFSPKSGQTIIGEPGAVLNGSKVLSGWSQDGGQWWVGGQSQQGAQVGVCENASSRCRYPEELFINNARLEHVNSRSAVGPGKWFFDYGADRIYIGDNPSGKTVETSVTEGAVYGNAPNVTITGLIVEKYANPAQHAAIDNRRHNGDGGADNWVISGNEVRWNHGVGIKVGKNARVENNNIHHNGQLGVGAVGSGAVFSGNEIAYNGQLSFLLDWERGGSKFADTTNIQLLNNYVHHNWGPGLWADDNAKDMVFANNTIKNNTKAGIYFEISYDALIRDNYIEGNGFGFTPWLWGGGIVISSSSGVEIRGNTVVNNADGIGAVEQDRFETAKYGPHIIQNLYVHGNTVTMSDGLTGVAQDVGSTAVFTSRNNRFENNTYNLSGSGNWFEWDNRQMSFDAWRGYGLN